MLLGKRRCYACCANKLQGNTDPTSAVKLVILSSNQIGQGGEHIRPFPPGNQRHRLRGPPLPEHVQPPAAAEP